MDTTQPMNLALGGSSNRDQAMYQGGVAVGAMFGSAWSFVKRHADKLFSAILVLLITFLIFVTIQNTAADLDLMQTEATLAGATLGYINSVYHHGCRSKGGCGGDCPYVDENDPRSVIASQLGYVQSLVEDCQKVVAEDKNVMTVALDRIASPDKRKTTETDWNTIIDTETACVSSLSAISEQLNSLDQTFHSASTIDMKLMDAKNKAIGLGNAASIQKNNLAITSMHLNAQVMIQYINDVPADRQLKIIGYDQLSTVANMAASVSEKSISKLYGALNANATDYTLALTGVMAASSASSQDIVTNMAWLINESKNKSDTVLLCIAKWQEVGDAYQSCRHVVDRFSNDLPGKMDTDKIVSLIQNGDYESAIIGTALEKDIVTNHQKYAKERSSFESGGGVQSVRDDDNDVNPWFGIFGRPTYRRSNGDSVDRVQGFGGTSDVLRSIPSDVPDKLLRTSSLRLGSLSYQK